MKNEKTYELVLMALFTAIIVIMAFTPLGYIPLVVINATIIHIPVILGALFLGPKKGAFLGFVFGLTSFINNTFNPVTASAFVFSPVIAYDVVGVSGIFKSIYICFVPRILVGVVPYFIYILIRKALKSEGQTGKIVVNLLASLILFISVRAFLIHLLPETLSALVCTIIGIAVGSVLMAVLTVSGNKKESVSIALAYAGLAGAFTNTLFVMSGIFILYKEAYAQKVGVAGEAVLDVIMGVVTFNGVVEAVVAAIIVAGVGFALTRVKPVYSTNRNKTESRAKA
ncbi:MAG: ECF transporter S component [Lachnospiraceae bacterium]|nr:ECF transporter S component [Lachnospiraceae bacterium]